MSKRVIYNRASLDSTISAAQKLVDEHALYIYATAFGFTIERTPPPFYQQGVKVDTDGSYEPVNTTPPWEKYA